MRQEIFCRMIFVTEVLLWTVIFYPFCVEGGNCDYLKLWILVGIPFGIRKMQIWIVPRKRCGKHDCHVGVSNADWRHNRGSCISVETFLLFVFMVLQLYKAIKKLIK